MDLKDTNPYYLMSAPPGPHNPEELLVIDKLAEQTVKNPALAQMVMQRQFGNPKYSFMRPDGQYHQYFQWKIQKFRQNLGGSQQSPLGTPSTNVSYTEPSRSSVSPLGNSSISEGSDSFDNSHYNLSQSLGVEKADKVLVLLEAIIKDCSQINIQHGRSWILENCPSTPHIHSLAKYLLHIALSHESFEPRLHILYLVNDMLFHSIRRRKNWIKDALYPHLVPILRAAYYAPRATDSQKEKVMKVVAIWEDKSYFEHSVISTLRSGMTSPISYGPSPAPPSRVSAQIQLPLSGTKSAPLPHAHVASSATSPPLDGSYHRPQIQDHSLVNLAQPISSGARNDSRFIPVAPENPKMYYELPPSSMMSQVRLTDGTYIPIKVSLLKSFIKPTHISPEIYAAVDDFYKELSEMVEEDGNLTKQSCKESFDSEGWKQGLLDDYCRKIQETLHKQRSSSSHSRSHSRAGSSYSRGRDKCKASSYSSRDSSHSRSSSRSRSRGSRDFCRKDGSPRSRSRSRTLSSASNEDDQYYHKGSRRNRFSRQSRSRSRSRSESRGRSRSWSPNRSRRKSTKRGYGHLPSRSRSGSRSRSRSRPRIDAPITEQNVGFKLLKKLGWDQESKSPNRSLHEPLPIGDVKTGEMKYFGLGHGGKSRQSSDVFESYRRARSYTYNRVDIPSSQEPEGCFRCGKVGHIARECRSHIP